MAKALVFCNVGDWESDMIGLNRIIEVDETNLEQAILDLAPVLCDEWAKDQLDEGAAFLRGESITDCIGEWELSYFTELSFDIAWHSSEDIGLFIALTLIN